MFKLKSHLLYMSSKDYYEKYLKYKNKYLGLLEKKYLDTELANDAELFADAMIDLKNNDIITEVISANPSSKDNIISALGTLDTNVLKNNIINIIKTKLSLKKENAELVTFITSLQSKSDSDIKNTIKNEYLNFLNIINDKSNYEDKPTKSTVEVELLEYLKKYSQIGGGKKGARQPRGKTKQPRYNWRKNRSQASKKQGSRASRRNERRRTHVPMAYRGSPLDIAVINSSAFLASLFSPIENNPEVAHLMISDSDFSAEDLLVNLTDAPSRHILNVLNILKYVFRDFLNYLSLIWVSTTNRTAREKFITILYTIILPTLVSIILTTLISNVATPFIEKIAATPSVGVSGRYIITNLIAPATISIGSSKISQIICKKAYRPSSYIDIDRRLIELSSTALLYPTVDFKMGPTIGNVLLSMKRNPDMIGSLKILLSNLNNWELTRSYLRTGIGALALTINAAAVIYRDNIKSDILTDAPLDNILIATTTIITARILVDMYKMLKSVCKAKGEASKAEGADRRIAGEIAGGAGGDGGTAADIKDYSGDEETKS